MWRDPPERMLSTLLARLAAAAPGGISPDYVAAWGARLGPALLAQLEVAHEQLGWPAWSWAPQGHGFGATMMLSPWTAGPAGARRRYWMPPMSKLPAWDDMTAWRACSVEPSEKGGFTWSAHRPGVQTDGAVELAHRAMRDADKALLALVGLPHNRRGWPGWMLVHPHHQDYHDEAPVPVYVCPWYGEDNRVAWSRYVRWCDRVPQMHDPGTSGPYVAWNNDAEFGPFAWSAPPPSGSVAATLHGRAADWPSALAGASRDLARLHAGATPLTPAGAPLAPPASTAPAGQWKVGDPYGWVMEVFDAAERELGVRLVPRPLGGGVNGQVFAVVGDPSRVVKITASHEEVAGMIVLTEWNAAAIPRIDNIVEIGRHSRPPDYPKDPRTAWAILREAVVPATDAEALAAYDVWTGPSVPRDTIRPHLPAGVKLTNYDRNPDARGWMPRNEPDKPRRGQPFLRAINMGSGVGYHARKGTPAQLAAAYAEYLAWLEYSADYGDGHKSQGAGVPHARTLLHRSEGRGHRPRGAFLDWHPGNVGRTFDGRVVFFDLGWHPLEGEPITTWKVRPTVTATTPAAPVTDGPWGPLDEPHAVAIEHRNGTWWRLLTTRTLAGDYVPLPAELPTFWYAKRGNLLRLWNDKAAGLGLIAGVEKVTFERGARVEARTETWAPPAAKPAASEGSAANSSASEESAPPEGQERALRAYLTAGGWLHGPWWRVLDHEGPPPTWDGMGRYMHLVRGADDPARVPRTERRGKETAWRTEGGTVASWRDTILAVLADDKPRTFNRIVVEATNGAYTADVVPAAETALWELVAEWRLAHTAGRGGKGAILFARPYDPPSVTGAPRGGAVTGDPVPPSASSRPTVVDGDDAEVDRAGVTPPTPSAVLAALDALGFDVGDYNRDSFLVYLPDGSAHQVKLEGWGAECVEASECSPTAMRRALAGARKLAREWRRQWPEAGVIVRSGEDDTWATTWAWNGPLSERGVAILSSRVTEDDIIRA